MGDAAPAAVVLVRPGRDLLAGVVEVDETFIGGEEAGLRGGRARGKKLLVEPPPVPISVMCSAGIRVTQVYGGFVRSVDLWYS